MSSPIETRGRAETHRGRIAGVTEIPVISGEAVFAAIDPARAIERTREAFERYGRGEWDDAG